MSDDFEDDYEQDFDDVDENPATEEPTEDEEVEFDEDDGFQEEQEQDFDDNQQEDDGDDEDFDKPVEEGETVELEIEDLGSKGDGIARVEGFVIFVPGGEVGESYDVEITSVGRKFAFGEIA
jgi:predicted RNA-binding protein with TRAM domain